MHTLTNSEDPDEMPHNVTFHQGVHCLLRHTQSSEEGNTISFSDITCDPSIYTMDHTKFIVSMRRKNPLLHKGLVQTHLALVSVQHQYNHMV